MITRRTVCVLVLLAMVGCRKSTWQTPITPTLPVTTTAPPPPPPQNTDLDSRDILARDEVGSPVMVKHVLVGWAELAEAYRGKLDPRAAKRTQAEAAKLAEEVATKLRANPGALDALIEAHSEDPGSLTKEPYTVESDTPFVAEFKNLALRLQLGEVGIVKTTFGYHVMVRVTPPPPDPLESADILARPTTVGPNEVQHVLIGWHGLDGTTDARAAARTKADADTLAVEILGKVRAGGDMAALMKQFSEDPGSKDDARAYTVTADAPMVEPFKQLALRLNVGEAGLVKTSFGWHIIKRVPPPPPDTLESTAIMKRTTLAEKVKVKHILLGWKEVNADDPRAKARTRAELEKLVKSTVAKLAKKGTKIEHLMAELSEDPGSANSGEAYDVTPTAGLVKPFLDLSLRLKLNEVGVVKTQFGIHIIKRVE